MEKNPGAFPRPSRAPTQEFWSPEACWRWRRRSESLLEKRGPESGFPNRAKWGHQGGPQGSQEGARRGLGWGRARDPSGVPVVALPSFVGDSERFWDDNFLYN